MVKLNLKTIVLLTLFASNFTNAQNKIAEQKAKLTEAKMTDDERFSIITSLVGYVPTLGIPKDERIPNIF